MNSVPAYFRRVNFSSQNEDWRTEVRALELCSEDVVACITGSGDRPLNLLAQCPVQAITAIDCNAAQNHLLELKVAAIETLDHADYLRFLGQADAAANWRLDTLTRLRDRLSVGAAAHWAGQPDAVGSGVLYCGRFERYFARIARIAKSVRPGVVDQLFEFDQIGAQRRFVADVWDTWLWRQVFRLLLHPLVSRLFYGDPAYFARVDRPVGHYLYERILTFLDTHLARNSFMLSLVLRGRLDDANLPPYLTEAGHHCLRQRVSHLEIVTSDLVEHLRAVPARTYSRFSLSDLPSYLDRRGMLRLLYATRRAARDKARDKTRMVIRQFLCRYSLPAHLCEVFSRQPELEAELAADDQAFAYEFVVADLDPRAVPDDEEWSRDHG